MATAVSSQPLFETKFEPIDNAGSSSSDLGTALWKSSSKGDDAEVKRLIANKAPLEKVIDGFTPLLIATKNGHKDVVVDLLSNKANVYARDKDAYTIINLAMNNNHVDIAKYIVKQFPDMVVTDPRLPKGAEWLTREFKKISDNVKDHASKPDPSLLKKFIKWDLGPIENRSVSHVYWEHILLRYVGDVPLDIQRNYSTSLTLSLVGTYDRILKGHAGIKESAELLNKVLPTTQYTIAGTVVETKSDWVTERWEYNVKPWQVKDGIDTFLIKDSKIAVMMINYNVEENK
ncbi:ankyrin repeat protein [Talaromyces proteolyticus]|uniref:Ankyrin repeat protein n=1 Tax=Talaromyces proteolyticus TaxID=1131652 RepID=A0AAD4PUL2_9EURO|nr:ankyrin repeat protein [Talaromyces proteolyticus]KAH8690222.1 ankyrin repeat protein [Talaromyces proteolyticus]